MAQRKPKRPRHRTQPPPLTAREIRFCQLWTERGNAYQCFLDAGFEPRVTRHATDQAINRLVRKREIREYCRHLQHVAATAAEMTTEEIAAGIVGIARFDARRLYDATGKLLPPHRWPADVAAVVESVEMGDVPKGKKVAAVKKVKTAARMPAWAKLAEWRRMAEAPPTQQGQPTVKVVKNVDVGEM